MSGDAERSNDVPWPRVLTEGAVIVLSILLAFALQAWWEARQERTEELAYLISLQSDFRESRARAEEHLARNKQVVENIGVLTRRVARPLTAADSAELSPLLAASFWIYNFEPGLATYQDMVNSGDLRLIESEALRLDLSRFEQKVELVDRLDQTLWEHWLRFDLPFLGKHYVLSSIYGDYRGAADRLKVHVSPLGLEAMRFEPDLSALQSRDFHNILVARALAHQNATVNMESTLVQIESILELIGSELRRFGVE